MQYLIKMLCFFKSKCDTFMKGSSLEETIAQPVQKLLQALANRDQNDKRAEVIAAGRKAGRKRAGSRSPARNDSHGETDARTEAEVAIVAPRGNSVSEQDRTRNVNRDVRMRGQDEGDTDDNVGNTSMDIVDGKRDPAKF